MLKVTQLPCPVRLRDGREGVITVFGKPTETIPYAFAGFSHPGRSMEFTELWTEDGRYHSDGEPSASDIIAIL